MKNYLICNFQTSEKYEKKFADLESAREWVVNHLDLSLGWSIFRNGRRYIK